MGIQVLKNKKSKYKLTNTVSDKRMHSAPWISEDKAKTVLIERALWDFYEKVITIDMEFPDGYGSMKHGRFHGEKLGAGSQWMIDNAYPKDGSGWEVVIKKVGEIKKRLEVDLEI